MKVNMRALLVALAAALLGLASLAGLAAAAEPEDPFWKVAGARLEAGSKSATIANVSGVKTKLLSKIGTHEVSIRCEKGALAEGALEGSQAKVPGKASGALELAECKLWAKEGEAFKEEGACKVATIKSGKLEGALWLEGTKAAGGTNAVALFKAKEGALAKVVIEGCETYKGTRSLEGSFALRLLPQNEEFTFIQWVLPETAVATVWLAPSQEAKVGLTLEGAAATLQGEMKTELTSHEKFGGGTEPMVAIEAPFWGVNGQRLELGEERELEDPPTAPVKLAWKLGKAELETRCNGAGFKEPRIKGSLNQHDGKFEATSLEFSECKLFAKEGGVYVEQPLCEVAPPNTGRLTGKLWLKGTSAGRNMAPVLVLEPETLTAGKPVLAKESVKGASCAFTTSEYAIEGALPFRLQPESVEAQIVNLNIPESATAVWQSAEQQAEGQVNLWHGSEILMLKIGNIPVKLKGGGPFGGGSAGVGEIGFETNTGGTAGTVKSVPESIFTLTPEGGTVTCKIASGEPSAGWVIQSKVIKENRQEAMTRGGHQLLEYKKWGHCESSLKNEAKVKCFPQVTRLGNVSVYPIGSAGCELFIGTEPEHCTVKMPVESNKELPGLVLENSGVNAIKFTGAVKGLTTTIEEAGGLCKLLKITAGKAATLKFAAAIVTEGEKLV